MHLEVALTLVAATRPTEAARALQGVMQLVSEQLASLDSSGGDALSSFSPEAIASMRGLLEDSYLQLLRLMISCHLSSGGHSAVLSLSSSYLSARGFVTAGSDGISATTSRSGDPSATADASRSATAAASCSISWDIWMLAAKSRCALKQGDVVMAEVQQALTRGCGMEMIEAVLHLLVQPVKQASGPAPPRTTRTA